VKFDDDDSKLQQRMARSGLKEADLVERFVAGSGPGGQKINKTASCVQIQHGPSGIEVHCQGERSREQNRHTARVRLCERFERMKEEQKLEESRNLARERYRKKRRSASQKRKLREMKARRSEKKSWRKSL